MVYYLFTDEAGQKIEIKGFDEGIQNGKRAAIYREELQKKYGPEFPIISWCCMAKQEHKPLI